MFNTNVIKQVDQNYFFKIESYEDFLKKIDVKHVIKQKSDRVTPEIISDSFIALEEHEERVSHILCNAKTYAPFRQFFRDSIDPNTKREELTNGSMALIWGAEIHVNNKIPDFVILTLSLDANNNFAVITELENNCNYNFVLLSEYKEKLDKLYKDFCQTYINMRICLSSIETEAENKK